MVSGGVPFELTHGQELYAYMDGHPEFDALFAQAMDSVEALTGDAFVTDFDWSRFERIIDVGGSKGAKSLAILKSHPHLKALVADREQVIQGAAQFWKDKGEGALLQRMSFEACDLLQSVPKAQGPRRQGHLPAQCGAARLRRRGLHCDFIQRGERRRRL